MPKERSQEFLMRAKRCIFLGFALGAGITILTKVFQETFGLNWIEHGSSNGKY